MLVGVYRYVRWRLVGFALAPSLEMTAGFALKYPITHQGRRFTTAMQLIQTCYLQSHTGFEKFMIEH